MEEPSSSSSFRCGQGVLSLLLFFVLLPSFEALLERSSSSSLSLVPLPRLLLLLLVEGDPTVGVEETRKTPATSVVQEEEEAKCKAPSSLGLPETVLSPSLSSFSKTFTSCAKLLALFQRILRVSCCIEAPVDRGEDKEEEEEEESKVEEVRAMPRREEEK